MKKVIAKVMMVSLLFAMAGYLTPTANAAGIIMYISDTADANYNDNGATGAGLTDYDHVMVDGAEDEQPDLAINTADSEMYFSWLASADFGIADEVVLTFPTSFSNVEACALPTTDADADGVADGAFAFVGNEATYTFTAATTDAAVNGVEFCVEFDVGATADNYVVFMDDGDFSAAYVYVHDASDDDANDMNITANVRGAIDFVITETANTTLTNDCDLGDLTANSIEECGYRLWVTTNAAVGETTSIYIVDVTAPATDGLYSAGAAHEITKVAENDTVTAGAEEYGIEVEEQGASWTETAPYDDDDTPTPTGQTYSLLATATGTVDGSFTTNTEYIIMTHEASVDTSTPQGAYTQFLDYYVVGDF